MISEMDTNLEATLSMLKTLEPVPTGPVQLSPEYLEAVEWLENHPANHTGADKTWVGAALRRNRTHFEGAKLP